MKVLVLSVLFLCKVILASALILDKPRTRIVNGKEAEPHSIPYQVFLNTETLNSGLNCSGILISPNYVLTAAHCILDGIYVEVILGAHNLHELEESQKRFISIESIVHEHYDNFLHWNDIGLVKLPVPVSISPYINYATLPTKNDLDNKYIGEIGKVSGWGLVNGTVREGHFSNVLRYTTNRIISYEECYEYNKAITKKQICLSSEGGYTSCKGDSGGPLTVNGTLVGIVSIGVSPCLDYYPTGLTRITSYLDWIQQNSDVIIK